VLSNILSNAVKFSERGSRIAVWTNSTDDWVQLRIRDSGIGIPSHVLERIFDPSAQTSRPGTEGEDGTGFGMPLVKQFVESYGGWVSIKSREREESPTEHGTEVCLHLRRAPVMAAGAQTTS
jgi:signal transduction histidine kinase